MKLPLTLIMFFGLVLAIVLTHGLGLPWLLHWCFIHFGIANESGPYYAFWSGAGSDVGEITLFGFLFTLWHKHNCHKEKCWHIGKHTVDGSPWCNRHHMEARQRMADTGSAHGVVKRTMDLVDNED